MRPSCLGLHQVRSWKPPRTQTGQPLWATCLPACLSSGRGSFSWHPVSASPLFRFCTQSSLFSSTSWSPSLSSEDKCSSPSPSWWPLAQFPSPKHCKPWEGTSVLHRAATSEVSYEVSSSFSHCTSWRMEACWGNPRRSNNNKHKSRKHQGIALDRWM